MANTTVDGHRRYVLFCAAVACLGAFQFGFNSGVVNQPRQAMTDCIPVPDAYPQNCIPMNDWQWGVFVSSFVLGGIVGGLSGGLLCTLLGRRRVLFLLNILFIFGGSCLAMGQTIGVLNTGRVFLGIATGISTVAVPLYINEISPLEQRGFMGTLNQLAIVLGVLVSVLLGVVWATPESWRMMFGFTILPSILQMLLIPFCVETPKWLMSQSQVGEAKRAIDKLFGPNASLDDLSRINCPEEERLHNEEASLEAGTSRETAEQSDLSCMGVLTDPSVRQPLLAALGLHAAQQFSGISAAIYYSTTIFNHSYSMQTATWLTILLSVINLIVTMISANLIEKVGRRTLLLASQGGMALCSVGVVLAAALNVRSAIVVCLVAFVGSFAIGLGSIPWLITSELVPSRALGPAVSLGTGINWGSAFLVALVFPTAVEKYKYNVFIFFASVLVSTFLFTYRSVPETRGKSPEQVAAAFDGARNSRYD
ncbi:general substrate transporter [Phlyctochytrium arcticum]|nr:general substrate transporter [Phlyctochytrium arcticum]